jgi:hypothetical protein
VAPPRDAPAGSKPVAATIAVFEARFRKARAHKDDFPKAYDDMLNAVFMIAILTGRLVPPERRGMRAFREELMRTIRVILQTNPRIEPRAAAEELGKRVPGRQPPP